MEKKVTELFFQLWLQFLVELTNDLLSKDIPLLQNLDLIPIGFYFIGNVLLEVTVFNPLKELVLLLIAPFVVELHRD